MTFSSVLVSKDFDHISGRFKGDSRKYQTPFTFFQIVMRLETLSDQSSMSKNNVRLLELDGRLCHEIRLIGWSFMLHNRCMYLF